MSKFIIAEKKIRLKCFDLSPCASNEINLNFYSFPFDNDYSFCLMKRKQTNSNSVQNKAGHIEYCTKN